MNMSLTERESLNILQWNARSAVANKMTLEKTLFEKNIHIALISETGLNQENSTISQDTMLSEMIEKMEELEPPFS